MKKILWMFALLLLIPRVYAEELVNHSKSAILVETSTGKVIVEKDSNLRYAPASMTKMMTLLLTFEAIDSGKISLEDNLVVSKNASSMGGSQMFLEEGEHVTLSDVIKGVVVSSANDGAVLLAEYVGGSVDNFVNMMNDKVNELGLTNTHFMNPHGLDQDNHYSSAYDMSVIARELIKHDTIFNYTTIYEDYFVKENGTRIWLVNTNKLIKFYEGVDGLKTGYTESAGYCLTATAKREGIRFLTVVMGSDTSEGRSTDTTSLLNYGFNSFQLQTLFTKGSVLGSVSVNKGIKDQVNVVLKGDVTELLSKQDGPKNYTYSLSLNTLEAPIKVGDVIGKVEFYNEEGTLVRSEDLTVEETVPKLNFLQAMQRMLHLLGMGI